MRHPLAEAPERARAALAAAPPTAEGVFRAFAAWCAAERFDAAVDRAWLALEVVEGRDWPAEVLLVRELDGPTGPLEVGAALAYPLPPALRARFEAPTTSWVEPPERADRLWGRFRAAIGPQVAAFAPRVRLLGGPCARSS